MPELPEVETIVNDLKKKIIGRKIIGVWFDSPSQISFHKTWEGKQKIIKKLKPKDFEKQIKGLKIAEIKRRGKNILIYLSKTQNLKTETYLLLIHQKMTGHLLCGKWRIERIKNKESRIKSLIKGKLEEKVNNYIHLIFYLDNGWQLGLSDLRKFAKVLFGRKKEIENLAEIKNLGPEPLDKSFNLSIFQSAIANNKRKIKQVLMDQEIIAGIGNIYSDEILWQAKVHPFKSTNKLSNKELKEIFSAMKQILKKAVQFRGTSISNYRDAFGKSGSYGNIKKVYQREGEPCLRCKTAIKRVKIGGRSSHFCPICQRF